MVAYKIICISLHFTPDTTLATSDPSLNNHQSSVTIIVQTFSCQYAKGPFY